MKTAAVVVLAVLLVADIEGMPSMNKLRCRCADAGVDFIPPRQIEKLEMFPTTSTCERVEIVITLKDNAGKKCLNPTSNFAKNFVKRALKLQKA
ncbi:C-X-C motif chemokine 11-6 [Amia ocellicauda]|uniref:C-X-C motif chemokine 11-6 n=1 Tax=Amia ocellicauda TaxID=2972642 RepID=UPI003464857A